MSAVKRELRRTLPGARRLRAMADAFTPRLVNDDFGDPVLHVTLRDERRALLFDLGAIDALPPRRLLALSHVFVSHAHMDHFAGFDTLLRVVLARKAGLVLVGGPGFADRVEHKLAAYTWNVVQRYEPALRLAAQEVGLDGTLREAFFDSRRGFAREDGPPRRLDADVLLDEPLLRVRGRFVDHGTPCLAFALEEKARVRLARDRLHALGLATGPWLRTLKAAVLAGADGATPIALRWRDRGGEHVGTRPLAALREVVLDLAPGQRLGFVTDLRDTGANRQALHALLAGVDRLYIESVFLDADRDHAERKNHLTARQAGSIARELGALAIHPFHFSPRYQGRAPALRSEALAAWRGEA